MVAYILHAMTTHGAGEEPHQQKAENHPEAQPHHVEQEISFKPMFRILSSYRKWIGIALGAVVTALVITLVVGYLSAPCERFASVTFRLLFEGVDKGQYPNGMAFSIAEIVSTPVLTEVYASNRVEPYIPDFESFKNSIFMIEANPEVGLLDSAYQARLSDPKLTPVDRARIEDEFRKKRQSLNAPIYSLNFRRGDRAVTMPASLLDKVLGDVLATWARQADQRKGALKYNIPIYSRNILQKEFILAADYIVALDILRTQILRIERSLDELSELPGAAVVRVGPERISLREVKANLEDILRFKLQPLTGIIHSSGISKDPKFLLSYMENQLSQVKLQRAEELTKVKTLQDSLRIYMSERALLPSQGTPAGATASHPAGPLETPALIPQFSESFLDRLTALATQNTDVEYRQDLTDRIIKEGMPTATLDKEVMYYEDMIKTLKGAGGGGSSSEKSAAIQSIKARLDDVMGDVSKAIDQINAIYLELSTQNLNPQTFLYRVTNPFSTRTERAYSLRLAVLYSALTLFLALILVPIGCLVHHYFRSGILDPERS
jgi:hypothetical protein